MAMLMAAFWSAAAGRTWCNGNFVSPRTAKRTALQGPAWEPWWRSGGPVGPGLFRSW